METKANYVAVGAFVLACVIGLVVTILWLAGIQYSQEYAYYQAYFKGPVTGLAKGTSTRYNGIEVGRITNLEFDPNDPQRVIVTMQVQPNLNIREDSIASIDSQGLTVFLVTHDIDTLRAVPDRIAVLVNQKLVIGTIEELRKNKDPWIQDYFSGVRGRAALASMDEASKEAR